MILFVSPLSQLKPCAAAVEHATKEKVELVADMKLAAARLRATECSALVIDHALLDTEPEDYDAVLHHAGTAVIVPVNFAITGADRLVHELRSALERRVREQRLARKAAQRAVYCDLRGPVTAMLLSCELALQAPNLPVAAREKVRTVHELAREMRARLSGEETLT